MDRLEYWIIFAFDNLYPSGGLWDIKASFATMEEVMEWIKANDTYDHYQVVNKVTWKEAYLPERL